MNKLDKAAVVSGEEEQVTATVKPVKRKSNPLGGGSKVKRGRKAKAAKVVQSEGQAKPKKAKADNNGSVAKLLVPVVATAITAVVAFSSLDALDTVSTVMLAADNAMRNKETSLSRLEMAEQAFVNQRTFEIAYSDLDSILELLEGVSGITVANVTAIDPQNGFAEVGSRKEVDLYGAARVTLAVSDVNSALKSLSKAQLAINTISMSGNNITLDVVLGVGEWQ